MSAQYAGEDVRSRNPGVQKMIDTIDQPGKASTADTNLGAGTFDLPKAGVGHAHAHKLCRKIKEGIKPDVRREACASALGGSEVSFDLLAIPKILEVIDTFDRPGNAFATSTYADAGTYAVGGENKPGKRLPKAGAYAGAGVGLARAEWSVFDAEAKGPNASAGAEASVEFLGVGAFAKAEAGSASASAARIFEAEAKGPNASAGVGASVMSLGVRAFTEAQLASASVSAGPLRATLGLAADTGVSISATGLEVKLLGTGFSIGRTTGVSLLGTGVECNIL